LPQYDIDSGILEFVDEYIDHFVAWDVLAYFHENQEALEKPSGIALEVGRQVDVVTPILKSLVEKGVLAVEIDTAVETEEFTYRYIARAEFRDKMEEFLSATRDRTNRLAIVGIVLQKEARRL